MTGPRRFVLLVVAILLAPLVYWAMCYSGIATMIRFAPLEWSAVPPGWRNVLVHSLEVLATVLSATLVAVPTASITRLNPWLLSALLTSSVFFGCYLTGILFSMAFGTASMMGGVALSLAIYAVACLVTARRWPVDSGWNG